MVSELCNQNGDRVSKQRQNCHVCSIRLKGLLPSPTKSTLYFHFYCVSNFVSPIYFCSFNHLKRWLRTFLSNFTFYMLSPQPVHDIDWPCNPPTHHPPLFLSSQNFQFLMHVLCYSILPLKLHDLFAVCFIPLQAKVVG